MAVARRPRRRRSTKRRRNPYFAAAPRRRNAHRRRSYRRNPILPTKMLSQALWLGGGFLAAPMISNLIPWTPASNVGRWVKTAVVTTLGAQLVGQFAGKKYANALLAGGYLSVAVDMLKSGTTLFGGGVGYYYPDDNALAAGWEGAGLPPGAEIPGAAIAQGRLTPRFH